MSAEKISDATLERTDFKLVLNNHLGRLSILSFSILDRMQGGYYPHMESFLSGLDALREMLSPYHETDFKKNFKTATEKFEKKEADLLKELDGTDRKALAHGLKKGVRDKLTKNKYSYLMNYYGILILLMDKQNLLLETRERNSEL